MRNWYLDKGSGKLESRPQIWGSSEIKYDDIHGLVALKVPADQDRLSEFIINKFGVFFLVCSIIVASKTVVIRKLIMYHRQKQMMVA